MNSYALILAAHHQRRSAEYADRARYIRDHWDMTNPDSREDQAHMANEAAQHALWARQYMEEAR